MLACRAGDDDDGAVDWDLVRANPLLALDGGGQGKDDDQPVDPLVWLRPGGVVVMDDFTPTTEWPPQFAGRTDRARLFWFEHPDMFTTEITTEPGACSVVAVRRPS